MSSESGNWEFVIIEKLTLALQLHQQGQMAEAADLYREILGEDSENADAWHFLGMISHQSGDATEAADFIRRAVSIRPDIADFHNNLADVYNSLGDHAAEEASCREAIRLRPTFFQAYNNLGNALLRQQRFSEAIVCYESAMQLRPGYTRAIESCSVAWRSHGAACRQRGQLEMAEESFQQALSYNPDDALVHNDLGEVLWNMQQPDEAVTCFRQALQIVPEMAAAHFNLANSLLEARRLDEAERSYRDCLTHDARFSGAMTNLAICLSDQGRTPEAMTWFSTAYELCLDSRSHSHLLVCQQYLPGGSPDSLQEAHAAWGMKHTSGFESRWPRFAASRDHHRRLRLGFVSRDFRLHPVGYFLVGPLESLDRNLFEVICYADQQQEDAMTERIRTAADRWICVEELSDDGLAERIREDQIDILVDLAGHTAGHRLLTFARKPAPVQVSWMGYVGTTGMAAMDFLMSDRFHSPEGSETHFTGERCILDVSPISSVGRWP